MARKVCDVAPPTSVQQATSSVPGADPSAIIFDAIQSAEAVAEQLRQTYGLAPERLYLRALAHTQASPELGLSISLPADIQADDLPVIGLALTPPATVAPPNQALCFKIQVVSVQRAYQQPALTGRIGLMLEKGGDSPYYRYTVGAAATVSEAQSLRQTLVREGFSGAYPVPFLYGERIDQPRARAMASYFPELRNFLDR